MIRSSKESNRDKRRARGNFSLPQVNNKKKQLTTITNQSPIFVPFTTDRVHTKKAVHISLKCKFLYRLIVELLNCFHLSLHHHSGYAFAVFAMCLLGSQIRRTLHLFRFITILNSRPNLLNSLSYRFLHMYFKSCSCLMERAHR